MKRFSPQNLKYMKRFAQEYAAASIGQQLIDQIPWGHLVTLFYTLSNKQETALESPHSDLATATLKNPYLFDFLNLGKEGLAEYRLMDNLPSKLQTALPTIEELEAELAKDLHSDPDSEE